MGTKDWSKRINTSLLSICIVDVWFAYSSVLDSNCESSNDFYGYLAEELIDNTNDKNGGRSRLVGNSRRTIINDLDLSPLIKNDGSGRCGLSIHLRPIKRKRIDCSGKVSSNIRQREV